MKEAQEQPPEDWKGYQKVMLTIDIVKANRVGLYLLLPVLLLYGLPFYLVHNGSVAVAETSRAFTWFAFLKWGVIFVGGIVAHELVHGITWALFAKKGFRSIRFGIFWKMLTPYCHCKEPLRVQYYLIGAIMPFIIVGFLPFVYAMATGSTGWLFFGYFYTLGAVGDFMIIYLLRNEKMTDYAQDHPSLPGCWVYRKVMDF